MEVEELGLEQAMEEEAMESPAMQLRTATG
jgi:hypothetical protein